MREYFKSVLLVCVLLSFSPPAWGQLQYTVTDLGAAAEVRGIAPDAPTVVGEQTSLAQVFYPTTVLIGTLPGGMSSIAHGTYGQVVVGESSTSLFGLYTHAFCWTPDGDIVDLGTLGDASLHSAATAVNAAGRIVGYATHPTMGGPLAAYWENGQIVMLPKLGPDGIASANAVNNWGGIVGSASATAAGDSHAVYWPPSGGILHIQNLHGTSSVATAINDAGQIAGYVQTPAGSRGFVWLPFTGMIPLLPLAGDMASVGYGINAAGVVVGSSSLPEASGAAILHIAAVRWDNGQPLDLNTLVMNGTGWTLESAYGIDDAGVIVGMGQLNGTRHGWLLTPMPPPSQALPSQAARTLPKPPFQCGKASFPPVRQ